MLRVMRPNTYKAYMPPVNSEFYDFAGERDEAAAALLARHLLNLLDRARRTKLRSMAAPAHVRAHTNPHAHAKNGGGSPSQWLHKLIPGSDTVNVYFPEDFLSRVVRDVLRMTEGEATGLRGCTLCVELWDGGKRVVLGKIVCDAHVKSTYVLYVRLVRGAPPEDLSGFSFPLLHEPVWLQCRLS
ncbi:uncharacterized protein LOC123510755 isoform X2 [Portunus trituberculatus]|uniref:uncharacterized protein LOC123510755 isoform X2 n=1 Tax=Portunus trituberculatus TaxID=210409 RepID=UPI001E1CFD5D|nr:uncharacterized protein LOC123510755 isoform X2 [Portunus trituberculatus]